MEVKQKEKKVARFIDFDLFDIITILLIMCGDIEVNPGPGLGELLHA